MDAARKASFQEGLEEECRHICTKWPAQRRCSINGYCRGGMGTELGPALFLVSP